MTAKKTDTAATEPGEEPVAAVSPDGEVIETTAEEIDEAMPNIEVVSSDLDVYRRMDLEDDRQILEELQGRALDVMLYSFDVGGKTATGFSWKGAREAVRTLNARGMTRIRVSPEIAPKVEEFVDEEGDEAYRVTVYAEDARHGGGNWGIATAKKKPLDTRGKPDKFAVTKALSKAQRNAFEALIPLEAVEYLKAQYLGQGQVKAIPGAGAPAIEKPTALDDEEARELVEECRAIYHEIHALNPLSMTPGAFNALLTQNQHSHDRLRDTKAHLEAFRDGERDLVARLEEYRKLVPSGVYDREVSKMAGMKQQRRLGKLAELVEQAEKAAAS